MRVPFLLGFMTGVAMCVALTAPLQDRPTDLHPATDVFGDAPSTPDAPASTFIPWTPPQEWT